MKVKLKFRDTLVPIRDTYLLRVSQPSPSPYAGPLRLWRLSAPAGTRTVVLSTIGRRGLGSGRQVDLAQDTIKQAVERLSMFTVPARRHEYGGFIGT